MLGGTSFGLPCGHLGRFLDWSNLSRRTRNKQASVFPGYFFPLPGSASLIDEVGKIYNCQK